MQRHYFYFILFFLSAATPLCYSRGEFDNDDWYTPSEILMFKNC